MRTDNEVIDRVNGSYKKDMIVLMIGVVLSVGFCAYQFYLHHFGLACILAVLAFINSLMVIMYNVFHNSTKRLMKQTDEMVESILREIEQEGK